jgi:hypothetical protein
MHCPRPSCLSDDIMVTRTYSHTSEHLKQRYRGMNLTRRHCKCKTCGRPFFSIEVTEKEFDLMYLLVDRAEAGRIR